MDGAVEFLIKNRQYRIVYMDGEHYILDVESSVWPIFIPFLFWIMPQKMYKIDTETVEKLKIPPDQKNKMGSLILIGIGGSAVLSQILKPILDFTIGTAMLVNALLLIITGAIIIFLRLYTRQYLRNRLRKTVDTDKLESVTIKVRPKYIKQYFIPIFGCLFWCFFLVLMIPGFLKTGDFIPLFVYLVFLPALLIFNTTFIHPYIGKTNLYRITSVN